MKSNKKGREEDNAKQNPRNWLKEHASVLAGGTLLICLAVIGVYKGTRAIRELGTVGIDQHPTLNCAAQSPLKIDLDSPYNIAEKISHEEIRPYISRLPQGQHRSLQNIINAEQAGYLNIPEGMKFNRGSSRIRHIATN